MDQSTDKGYLGNPQLKRKGTKFNWTKKRIKEVIKCSEDPIYFAEKYIQIVHVDHGLIPIKMYDYQKEISRLITDNRRVAVVTSRQAGKCHSINSIITIRNKNTGEVKEITIGEFYALQNKKNNKNDDIQTGQ